MIKEIDFKIIPGLSRFFLDFLSKKGFICERFLYFDELLENEEIVERKLKSYINRDEMIKLVKVSSSNLDLSENQKLNLELLSKDNTLVVVTSINPFFLGGPLSVLYKTLTSIFIAKKLSTRFPNYNFVPIIWIEDNDHNCTRSFQINLLNKNYELVSIPVDNKMFSLWRNSISDFRIPKTLINFLEIHIHTNEYVEKNSETSTFFINLYKSETSLTKTFVQILHYLLKNYGLLFLVSSVCRVHNSFAKILIKEIETPGASSKIIEKANKLLGSRGIQIKSKNSFLNIFYHTKDRRVRLDLNLIREILCLDGIEIERKEIVDFFEKNSNKFSPNVLLRPICQDFILPT
ncbi:MAG: bacillithiol biosynthesis BshC, partial [Candidatus Kapaibacteriota bacterium]